MRLKCTIPEQALSNGVLSNRHSKDGFLSRRTLLYERLERKSVKKGSTYRTETVSREKQTNIKVCFDTDSMNEQQSVLVFSLTLT